MFYKTISKKSFLVISLLFVCFNALSCSLVSSNSPDMAKTRDKDLSKNFRKPRVVGRIRSREITESSGLVASRCNKDVFWTHNDSGNGAFIYAINKKGLKLGTWRVAGARNKDWEDIATFKGVSGDCFLYIGDIGNNVRTRRTLTIYKVKEPRVLQTDISSSKKSPRTTQKAEQIMFTYPILRRNAEALMVHPQTEDIYVLTKRFSGASGVYKLSFKDLKRQNTIRKIGDISVPALPNGLLTGAEIAPDGKRVILCDYFNAYEIALPKSAKDFDEIWKHDPSIIELGKRDQGEAICYSVDIRSIYATSEKTNSPFIEVKRK